MNHLTLIVFGLCSLSCLIACGDDDDANAADVAETDVREDAPPEDTEPEDVADTAVTEVLSGCNNPGPATGFEQWSVIAGTPERVAGGVQGCMTFVREGGAETRGGGLCLLADLSDGLPCETQQDCVTALGAPLGGGFHYCTAPAGSATKACWTRPGPGELYCTRNPARQPGDHLTPVVHPNALGRPTKWMAYACIATSTNPAGCGADSTQHAIATGGTLEVPDVVTRAVAFYGCDGNFGDTLASGLGAGALHGMTATFPGSLPSPEFEARLLAENGELALEYAPESYDAVIVAALAAHVARANTSAAIAEHLVGVTTRGERCTDFASCVALIEAGKDIDYDGESGPIEFTDGGEPALARFTLVSFGADNTIDREGASTVIVGAPTRASTTTPAAPSRQTEVTGGALRIGGLLPVTGSLAFLGEGMRTAVALAVADINSAGGVNGVPVELFSEDEGGFDDDLVVAGAAALIAADVDVVIGAASSARTFRVIDTLVAAGVPMISPSNTSDALSVHDDDGLYFRTSPPDVMQARALAERVHADGHTRVAVLALDDDYGLALSSNLTTELVALGLTAANIRTTTYLYEGPFDAAVDASIAATADALLFFGFDETNGILRLLGERGYVSSPRAPTP